MKEISKGVVMQNEEEDITEETFLVHEESETDKDEERKQTSENEIRQRQPRKQISSEVESMDCPG